MLRSIMAMTRARSLRLSLLKHGSCDLHRRRRRLILRAAAALRRLGRASSACRAATIWGVVRRSRAPREVLAVQRLGCSGPGAGVVPQQQPQQPPRAGRRAVSPPCITPTNPNLQRYAATKWRDFRRTAMPSARRASVRATRSRFALGSCPPAVQPPPIPHPPTHPKKK